MNPTLSSPRSDPPPLTPVFGKEKQENAGPGFSPFTLFNTGGESPPRQRFTFKLPPFSILGLTLCT